MVYFRKLTCTILAVLIIFLTVQIPLQSQVISKKDLFEQLVVFNYKLSKDTNSDYFYTMRSYYRVIENCRITFYSTHPSENGYHTDKDGDSITAKGNKVTPGISIAVERGFLPFGTLVYIPGVGIREVDDIGVYGNHIDVAVETKEEAAKNGVFYTDVFVLG